MISKIKGILTYVFIIKFLNKNKITLLHTINRGDQVPFSIGYIQDEIIHKTRFIRFIATENGKKVFAKIPLTRKSKKDFKRQIDITNYLTNEIDISTPKIVSVYKNVISPIYYASFEYLPLDNKEGFYYNAEYNEKECKIKYKQLTKEHLAQLIKNMVNFTCKSHENIPNFINFEKPSNLGEFMTYFKKMLNKNVYPIDIKGKVLSLNDLISQRVNVCDFGKKLNDLFELLTPQIEPYDILPNYYLVHGDFSLNNIYFFQNHKVVFIDYEFLGYTKSPLWSCCYDYGELRARQWGDVKFRLKLDKELLDHFERNNNEMLGKLILTFSILKYGVKYTEIFESYNYEKQSKDFQQIRKKQLIDDLKIAWELWGKTL